jgi:hypothetical protein
MVQGILPKESFAANFILDHFLKIGRFKIKWMRDETQPIIGLHAFPEDKIHTE